MEKKLENILNKFVKEKLNKNAPLQKDIDSNISNEYKNYKYPYKPALLISILTIIEDVNKLFNNDISIDDRIAKRYYDILVNSDIFYNAIQNLKSKKSWLQLGFNREVKNSIINNIFEMPAIKLIDTNSNFWSVNKKNKTIRMNLEASIEDKIEFKDKLLSYSFQSLKNCLPDYSEYTLDEIIKMEEELINIWTSTNLDKLNKDYSRQDRRYQHIFRKTVLDRDERCIICCVSTPEILEACHIRPYVECDNDIDRYCNNNGITLCKNHHKLFDIGYFTFDEQWRIKISNKLSLNDDFDILIKTFESCYNKQNMKNIPNNKYLEYHRKNIFIEYGK